MSQSRAHFALLVAGAIGALLLAGCSADGADADQAGQPAATAAEVEQTADAVPQESAPAAEPEPSAERPEGLDASLPVPPGTLVSATPEASAWEYIYSEVTSDEARAFADELKAMGFEQKITVDSDGVEQWYLQSEDWAIKLEETHADESLMYWVDPIIE